MPPPQHPPITPSPHRFLPSSSSSKPLPSKQTPTLRSRPHLQIPHQLQQFALTPRFQFASRSLKADGNHEETRDHSSTAPPSSSSPGIPLPRPRLPVHARDEIRGNSDGEEEGVQDVTEDDGFRAADSDQKHFTCTASSPSQSPVRKRRRRFKPAQPMDPDTVIQSSSPTPSPPSHERAANIHTDDQDDDDDDDDPSSPPSIITSPANTATTTTHPRFRPIPSSPPSSHSLPKFLLPTPSSPASLAPPYAFSSPQRRNAKFVPGGLAAAMRNLVLETAMQQQQQRVRESRNLPGTETVAALEFRVRVREVRPQRGVGTGMVLVREQVEDVDGEEEEGKGWVLIGPGTGTGWGAGVRIGVSGGDVRKGDVVGVRRPVWEMEVAGEQWTVGIDWALLR